MRKRLRTSPRPILGALSAEPVRERGHGRGLLAALGDRTVCRIATQPCHRERAIGRPPVIELARDDGVEVDVAQPRMRGKYRQARTRALAIVHAKERRMY